MFVRFWCEYVWNSDIKTDVWEYSRVGVCVFRFCACVGIIIAEINIDLIQMHPTNKQKIN